jgi:hypothetical protein
VSAYLSDSSTPPLVLLDRELDNSVCWLLCILAVKGTEPTVKRLDFVLHIEVHITNPPPPGAVIASERPYFSTSMSNAWEGVAQGQQYGVISYLPRYFEHSRYVQVANASSGHGQSLSVR